MATAPFNLPPFNREAEFVVTAWPRGHTCNGVQPRPGDPVDKTKFSSRVLRSLYESRWIAMAPTESLTTIEAPKRTGVAPIKPGLEVRHFGQGRWAVARDGLKVSDFTSRHKAFRALERIEAEEKAAARAMANA